jgi:hypothetical protein
MRCVNHPDVDVQSYCQSCGKALCASCVRTTATGQILCEADYAAAGNDPSKAYWQPVPPYPVGPPPGSPNPAAAAVLGLIPGVGAMYNGQLFKGLIHVVIFVVLVSLADHYGVFGFFIAAWVLYQSFEAFHTAKARRDGLPLPDPFGLNELGSWLNLGGRGTTHPSGTGYAAPPPPPPPPGAGPVAGSGVAGTEPIYSAPYTGTAGTGGGYIPPYPPYPPQPPYGEPFPGAYPPGSYPPGAYPPGVIPPIPPDPTMPCSWRRREPVWAVVLIGLGVIFLLNSLGFVRHFTHYAWPLLLIGLGVWLFVRRMGYMQGGPK